jgi:hypothetical protein
MYLYFGGMMIAYWAENNPAGLIRKCNRESKGKPTDLNDGWKPSEAWCRDVVLSQHSTLDWASIIFEGDFRADVISHLVRHTNGNPRFVVCSWREDWTGNARPTDPGALRGFISKWNIRALLKMMQERLCYQAMEETRKTAEEMKRTIMASDDILMKTVGWASVPQCVYREGCPFGKKSCGLLKKHYGILDDDIEMRYHGYNEMSKYVD